MQAQPQESAAQPPLVTARGLVKYFDHGGRRLDVLRGVDFELRRGEMVAVVGRSGAGKSTLLHVIGTIDRPSAGVIQFEKLQLNRLSQAELASFRNRSIGFVFQFHHLLPEFTAIENVMMPALFQRIPRRKAEARAVELLHAVELGNRMSHRPAELSGGEQQRVALARALVMKPKLILADEPTGNLDSQTGAGILDLFFSINRESQTTMLIVTHSEDLARRMTRTLRMEDGRLCVSDGAATSASAAHDGSDASPQTRAADASRSVEA